MRFGLDIAQHLLSWDEVLARVRFAEEVGFDGAWVFDHFKPLEDDTPIGSCMEGWTLLAALAASTPRIRLGTMVTGITYRHPSVLAAEAVTVDHISNGRLELGVGAAWFEEEHRELGIPFPPVAERMDRLEEGVQVLRLLMTEDEASFEGKHFRLDGATYLPRPVQQPHPPIWIGGDGPRRLIPIAGRHADVWHSASGDPEELRSKVGILDRAAKEAGRDPSRIVRGSFLSISERWDEVRRVFDRMVELGFSYFVVSWPTEGKERLDEFVAKVLPELGS